MRERLLALPEVERAGTILAFVSVRSEIPTTAFLETVLRDERRLLLPYVSDDGSMHASIVGSLAELEPGYRGIPEPRGRMPVEPGTADVAVVPGVAFDARGARLGYGGGFYDRFLETLEAVPVVGICFDLQIVDEVPMERHDRPVDVVVTEERTLRRPD